jgi:hypothetical protein
MTRATFGILSCLLAIGLVATLVPYAGAEDNPCVNVPNGYQACGKVTIVGCGVASAEGASTGSVHWKFTVTTHSNLYGYHSTTHEADGTAYAHTTTDWCATDTCTWGSLYADNVLVDAPIGVC